MLCLNAGGPMQSSSINLIGREGQLKTLTEQIRCRKSIHIYGTEGCGKTELLLLVYSNWKNIDRSITPVYCNDGRNLRDLLLTLALQFLSQFKKLEFTDRFHRRHEFLHPHQLKSLNLNELKKAMYNCLSKRNFCIILDHLENVTPRVNSFLSVLYERTVVITASRQSWEIRDPNSRGRLEYCLYLTPKLRIENLSPKDAFLLMENIFHKIPLKVHKPRKLFAEVYHITKGNPGMITDIFRIAERGGYISGGNLNLNLLLLDRKIKNLGNR
jgi:hypothetical protein